VDLPSHIRTKQLAGGKTGYYWELPPWARGREGCPVSAQPLKGSLAEVVATAERLNATLEAFRRGETDGGPVTGSIDWLIRWFERHPRYKRTSEGTQGDYSDGLRLIADHVFGEPEERVGSFQAASIRPYHVDSIYLRLLVAPTREKGRKAPGPKRLATVNSAMRAARRMWNVALRDNIRDLIGLSINPFSKMELESAESSTVPATREQLEAFIAKADELGHPSMGTAALVTFELIQREVDVIGRLSWSDLESRRIRVRHHKTKKMVWISLYDDERGGDGQAFMPELVGRLANTPRRGTLIIMRDQPDRLKKIHLPYGTAYFQRLFREIAVAAALPSSFTFLGCRTGGMTELGDSGATDQEITAVSTRSRQTITVYTKQTKSQISSGLRKRRRGREGNEK
jgi:hypothetical protein